MRLKKFSGTKHFKNVNKKNEWKTEKIFFLNNMSGVYPEKSIKDL